MVGFNDFELKVAQIYMPAAAVLARLRLELSEYAAKSVKLQLRIEELEAALSDIAEEYEGCVQYYGETDEIGDRACCGVLSYKPHREDCVVVKAKMTALGVLK